jgi:iron(III) transport system ATP-binding protein
VTTLEVAGVHKAFGTNAVLRGVDLSVAEGSFTAILGPSGSGKTTLLRILVGLERADRGTVALGGRQVDGASYVPPEHRGVGYVPQEGALFPHLTVTANIAFGLPRDRRRVPRDDLLEMVGLGGLGRRYPHQLSGGQQQRVALARALAVEPSVVLLDEPFSSLDAGLRASVREDVHDVLRRAGTTSVLVTHDQDEALSMADEVAVIRHGRIAQCGSPEELYERPVDADLARFLGAANLLDGTVSDRRVATALGTLDLLGPSGPGTSAEVVALVRPEQLTVHVDPSPGTVGVRGTVRRFDYHGHDAVATVALEQPCGTDEVVARTPGSLDLRPGTAVVVTASGSCLAWPRTSAASEVGDLAAAVVNGPGA